MSGAEVGSVRRGALATAAVVLLLALAAAWGARHWPGVAASYAPTVALLFAAGMAVAAAFVDPHHPFSRFGPANQVTTIRAALVALVVALLLEPATRAMAAATAALGTTVMVLDGVDGWLARRTRMSSPFGARFDVETDAIFVLTLSALVWRHDKAGAWVIAGGLYRYGFVAAGWIMPWMSQPLRPTRRARVVAACHMLALTVAVAPIVSAEVAAVGVATTLVALTWSFAIDVGRLWRGDTA